MSEIELLDQMRRKFSNCVRPGLIFSCEKRLDGSEVKKKVEEIWSQHRLAESCGKPMLLHDDVHLFGYLYFENCEGI